MTFFPDMPNQGCETLYKCCGQDIKSQGCSEICKKCGSPWGSPANNCFKKKHELKPVEIEV